MTALLQVATQAADFSELFGSEDYSDVDVLIYEEEDDDSSLLQQAGKRPRRAEELLPCHRVVRRALSQYFRSKVRQYSPCFTASSSAPRRLGCERLVCSTLP